MYVRAWGSRIPCSSPPPLPPPRPIGSSASHLTGPSLGPSVGCAQGFLPGSVKDAAMGAYEKAGGKSLATEELERQHGRLAMLGVLGFAALSALF